MYGYRWIVLILFMIINMIVQILWISFASVTTLAESFYSVGELEIYLLSMSFMIVYIPVTFLASWIIDKYGFKIGTVIGALLTAIFGFLRIFTAGNYLLVLIFQIGIAIGQPFLLNSVTKLSANWFPPSERTTASGISLIAVFIGMGLGMVLPVVIVSAIDFQTMLTIFGVLSLIIGIIYIIFVRNKPPTPPSTEIIDEKVFMFEGLSKLFKSLNFLILFAAYFVGLGILNTVLTYIEGIVMPRGYTLESGFAGMLGLCILIGGILGALIMSMLSDKYKKRKILIIISLSIATVSLLVISFVNNYILLILAGLTFGFGLISSAPVGLEYAVDITKPVPEATSNGILLMGGQIGGILFILGLENLKMPVTGDYFPALIIQTIILAIVVVLLLFVKEKTK